MEKERIKEESCNKRIIEKQRKSGGSGLATFLFPGYLCAGIRMDIFKILACLKEVMVNYPLK